MKHGSLFSGIGGFDLAAQWMGWENEFHCEINSFCNKILNHYWPKAKSYGDIKKTDFTIWKGKIDILTGGFPCQPFSDAGKRKGTEDDRHLWPEMLRAIREIAPRWIVGENVRGLINWSKGVVFEQVQADLENEGYQVWPYLLPACSLDAPHQRYRVWFVAYNPDARIENMQSRGENGIYRLKPITHTDKLHGNISGLRTGEIPQQQTSGIFEDSTSNPTSYRREGERKEAEEENRQQELQVTRKLERGSKRFCNTGNVTNTNNKRQSEQPGDTKPTEPIQFSGSFTKAGFDSFPTQPPVCFGNDGFSTRLDGITFSKWRRESIQGAGNAVVPQLVYEIFRTIEEFETSH